MKIGNVAIILGLVFLEVSCSKKSNLERNANSLPVDTTASKSLADRNQSSIATEPESENEREPAKEEIGEDCVAFLRATKTIPREAQTADCPQCEADGKSAEVLKFIDIKIDEVTTSGDVCEVLATIRGTFNPSTSEQITGGLVAWITPAQREQYRRGETPAGVDSYKLKVVYRRKVKGWRAVEFDKP